MQYLNDIFELVDDKKAILLDNYGTLVGGHGFYPGVLDIMRALVHAGKKVVIFTNDSRTAADVKTKIDGKGAEQDTHYHEIISSGQVLWEMANSENNWFAKLGCKKPCKYWTLGQPYHAALPSDKFKPVDDLGSADLVYLGYPGFSAAEIKNLPPGSDQYLCEFYDWHNVYVEFTKFYLDQISNYLDFIQKKNIPVVSPNPDISAEISSDNQRRFIVEQGTVVKYLHLRLGHSPLEIGKPYAAMYDHAKKTLFQKYGIMADEIIAIGDSIDTDIKGAENAGLDSALVTENGLAREQEGDFWNTLLARQGIFGCHLLRGIRSRH